MNYNEFIEWLVNERHMNIRSARDVASRVKRCLKLVNKNMVDDKVEKMLLLTPEFVTLSSFVKSQLKRSITLYMEFLESICDER